MNTTKTKSKEWFDEWFDSPYYHILYKHRDDTEAQRFMDNLSSFLHITPEHKIMDLACGKGRHSIYLNQKGFDVVGLDLSKESIQHAQQFSNERLHFAVHDKRDVYKVEYFDYILNMFTSFGYFASEEEHIIALQAAAAGLKDGGRLVIDFFNTYKVLDALVYKNEVVVGDLVFHLSRHIHEGAIVKKIEFEDQGKAYQFEERVQAFTEQDFRRYFEVAHLKLLHLFGDYELSCFDKQSSERMIFIVEKE
ncbi:MAG: SAM-dependent methyltransferase [Flammeovirgaceae bacterium]